jgi:hypothetical protein
MAIINGIEVEPRFATNEQTAMIQRILDLNEQVKSLIEERDVCFANLCDHEDACRPLVVEIALPENRQESEYRLIQLGTPKGHYVYYRDLDFVVNRKAAAKDINKCCERPDPE